MRLDEVVAQVGCDLAQELREVTLRQLGNPGDAEKAATPDLIGVDHYLTSERFLDDRLDHHPDVVPGDNGRHCYADIEAVRIPEVATKVGTAERLREVWARYQIPLVVGEVHHGCTREEQARWFLDVWRDCETVRAEGIDLRAVPCCAVMASANKCLEGVPGVAFVLAEVGHLAAMAGSSPGTSLDLHAQWRGFEASGQWRFTPPTHVLAALDAALDGLDAEGGVTVRGARYARHCAMLAGGWGGWASVPTCRRLCRVR